MAAIVTKQQGQKIVMYDTVDANNTVTTRTKLLPHAFTHTPTGADPLDVKTLGGLTVAEVRKLIAESARDCQIAVPGDVEVRGNKGIPNGYCPLNSRGKVDRRFLPEYLNYGSYMSFDTVFPGALYVPSADGGRFDSIRPPCAVFIVSMQANLMTPPDSASSVDVDVLVGDSLITPTGVESHTFSLTSAGYDESVVFSESGEKIMADVNRPITLKIKAVGSSFPGEYLRMHIITRVYKVVNE